MDLEKMLDNHIMRKERELQRIITAQTEAGDRINDMIAKEKMRGISMSAEHDLQRIMAAQTMAGDKMVTLISEEKLGHCSGLAECECPKCNPRKE